VAIPAFSAHVTRRTVEVALEDKHPSTDTATEAGASVDRAGWDGNECWTGNGKACYARHTAALCTK